MRDTYVKCADWTWEEKLLYIKACIGEDIPHSKICGNASYKKSDLLETYKNVAAYIYCYSNGMISFNEERDGLNSSANHGVEVNLSELKSEQEKPKRVKVSYERVDFVEHWEYFKLMSKEGDLYVNCTDLSYEGLYGDNINLANALHDGSCIYRKVETEMDWRDEVKSKYSLVDFRNTDDEGCHNLGDWTPEGFVKLCHFVAEMTDKPTN